MAKTVYLLFGSLFLGLGLALMPGVPPYVAGPIAGAACFFGWFYNEVHGN